MGIFILMVNKNMKIYRQDTTLENARNMKAGRLYKLTLVGLTTVKNRLDQN